MDLIAGKYVLDEQIGRGAMGLVYRGRETGTGETVAIKMLDPHLVDDLPELIERFKREGEALQQLNHPNIVKLLATAEQAGKHYLVMEFVRGGDLAELLHKHNRLAQSQALTIALDLADALTRAHRLEILHRDLKPANVLIDENGLPRLSDFGIARLGKQAEITAAGSILGTVAYLSPEACMGEPLDERADIWSFGVMLYEMLSGQRPFRADTAVGTISHILHEPLLDIRELLPEIPDALEDLLYRMLAKNRGDRIPSVRLVGAEIEALLREQPSPSTAAPAIETDKTAIFRDTVITPTPERLFRAKNNLPAQTTPFVGREIELAELERLIAADHQRLVTILGPGGMGKTRLSLEVASRIVHGTTSSQVAFPDGVFFVELAAVSSVEQMFPAIAAVLGFAIEKEIEPQQQIINYFSNKRSLLLLDNFEHLLAEKQGAGKAVAEFLHGAAELQILVTSRQKLNLTSETIMSLDGLDFPDWQSTAEALNYSAVQLFVQSAKRAQIDFALDETSLSQVAEICRLTAGMPLAILLAASWIDMLSLPEIVSEMQADLDFLESAREDLPPRQRSMRAVFDYSWAMLNEKEQDILAKLSVFEGGFTREAAQVVAGASSRLLLGLVNKSLIQRNTTSGRFTVHELLRQLAAEKLAQIGELVQVRTAHSHYFFQQIQKLVPTRLYLIEMAPDIQNLKSAWLWGGKQKDVRPLQLTIEPIYVYFTLMGREFELVDSWLEVLTLLPERDPAFQDTVDDVTAVRAAILNRLQDIGYLKDDKDRAIDIDALHLYFQASGAKLDQAINYTHLAYREMRRGDFQQAIQYFKTQHRLLEEEEAFWRLSTYLAVVATIMYRVGQIDAGLVMARRALELAEQNNDEITKGAALIAIAYYNLREQLDYETAAKQYAEATELGLNLWEQGLAAGIAILGLAWQGQIALLQGKLADANRFAQEIKSLADVRNNSRDKRNAVTFRSLIEATTGHYRVIEPTIVEKAVVGHTTFASSTLILNACGRGDVKTALIALASHWSQPMLLRWHGFFFQMLPAAAFILAEKGEVVRAASLMALGWGHPACPHGWWKIMDLVQKLEVRFQNELSAKAYTAAQARGREIDLKAEAAALIEELKAMAAELE